MTKFISWSEPFIEHLLLWVIKSVIMFFPPEGNEFCIKPLVLTFYIKAKKIVMAVHTDREMHYTIFILFLEKKVFILCNYDRQMESYNFITFFTFISM